MKKREGEVKEILDLAGSVIADKGFQGSGYEGYRKFNSKKYRPMAAWKESRNVLSGRR